MKICTFFLFGLLFLSLFTVTAQVLTNPSIKPNTAFIDGEKLIYEMNYGIISAGVVELSLHEERYHNELVFHSESIAKTAGLADKIYGVKDMYESWFDKESNLPYKDEMNVKEGNYKKHNKVTYNRIDNTVDSKLSGIHQVPEFILDLASILYYVRRVDFSKINVGDDIFLNMYFSDEVFPFHFIYDGKQIIETEFGKISCIKLNPVVEVGRMFKHSDDLTMWLSDDGNLIPILIRLDIRIVGAIDLYLTKYENTANPLLFTN